MHKLLPEIIERFYDAAVTPAAWQDAVDLLNVAMPSVAFALYGHDFQSNTSTGDIQSGFDPRAMEDFRRYYASVNVWARGFSKAPVGSLVTSDSFVSRDELKRSEYYNDWLRPQEGQVAGWGSVLANDSRSFLAISSTMRERDADRLDDELRMLIASIQPHVQRAFRLAGDIARRTSADAQSWIEMLDGPAFALDPQGFVVAANARAAEVADALEASPRLVFRDRQAQQVLDGIVRDIATRGSSSRGAVSATSPSGRRWSALVTPMPGGLGSVPGLLVQYLPQRPVALVLLRPASDDAATLLRSRFGLSGAETDVALLLADGLTIDEIANRRRASIHTVRNQLRTIFDKTGVTRQAALVKLLLSPDRSDESIGVFL